jgi:hypothetical protein
MAVVLWGSAANLAAWAAAFYQGAFALGDRVFLHKSGDFLRRFEVSDFLLIIPLGLMLSWRCYDIRQPRGRHPAGETAIPA